MEYSFLVKRNVQILHGDNFGDQLAFYEVLFAISCYGLYKLNTQLFSLLLFSKCAQRLPFCFTYLMLSRY